jgi:hypothetical protein
MGAGVSETVCTLSGTSQQPPPATHTNVNQKNNRFAGILSTGGLDNISALLPEINSLRNIHTRSIRLIFGNLPKIIQKNYFGFF